MEVNHSATADLGLDQSSKQFSDQTPIKRCKAMSETLH